MVSFMSESSRRVNNNGVDSASYLQLVQGSTEREEED